MGAMKHNPTHHRLLFVICSSCSALKFWSFFHSTFGEEKAEGKGKYIRDIWWMKIFCSMFYLILIELEIIISKLLSLLSCLVMKWLFLLFQSQKWRPWVSPMQFPNPCYKAWLLFTIFSVLFKFSALSFSTIIILVLFKLLKAASTVTL